MFPWEIDDRLYKKFPYTYAPAAVRGGDNMLIPAPRTAQGALSSPK
jgi:hypothetical protein